MGAGRGYTEIGQLPPQFPKLREGLCNTVRIIQARRESLAAAQAGQAQKGHAHGNAVIMVGRKAAASGGSFWKLRESQPTFRRHNDQAVAGQADLAPGLGEFTA